MNTADKIRFRQEIKSAMKEILHEELGEILQILKAQNSNQAISGFNQDNTNSSDHARTKFSTKDQIDRLKQQSNEAMRNGRVSEAVRLYNRAWEMERGIKKGERVEDDEC